MSEAQLQGILPAELSRFAGRLLDADAHEMMPLQEWERHFGADIQPLIDAWIATGQTDADNINHPYLRDYCGDTVPIGPDLLTLKGSRAPGATDMRRRLEVMDAMGIGKQLMFPTAMIWPIMMLLDDRAFVSATPAGARRETIFGWLRQYNDWAIGVAKETDRIRPVAPLVGDTPDELIQNACYLMDNGIRALWLLSGVPPGGRSPAHPDLDPLWALMAERNCVGTLHLAAEGKFFETREWRNAPAFDGFRAFTEFDADPWTTSVYHIPSQNFLTTMVVGGVFERHPDLRFGVIEVGAWWLGPLMELLDLSHRQFSNIAPDLGLGGRLPQDPSFYIKRNVKVTPFYFEDIATYYERYDCSDILCFSTDYPHVEGGKDTFRAMFEKVKPFGPEAVEKFFVKNAQFLFPE